MQTLDVSHDSCSGLDWRVLLGKAGRVFWPVWLVLLPFIAPGCKKDPVMEAVETDANGYVCLKCGAKLCTDRKVFIGPACPKCQEQTLMSVVGYLCDKDHHLTIRASRNDPVGPVCEQCKALLNNSMYMPKEKDLKAWGATKQPS